MTQLLAMYGGTFDPVHYGHLKPVEILANQIGLNQVTIVPNNVPPHLRSPKPPATNAGICWSWPSRISRCLSSTIANSSATRRHTPRKPCASGARSKGQNGRWRLLLARIRCSPLPRHDYESILDNVHLIVCRRPGYPLTMACEQDQQWLDKHLTHDVERMHSSPAGLSTAETPWFDISATLIRQRLESGESCADMLPETVLDYIHEQKLYC